MFHQDHSCVVIVLYSKDLICDFLFSNRSHWKLACLWWAAVAYLRFATGRGSEAHSQQRPESWENGSPQFSLFHYLSFNCLSPSHTLYVPLTSSTLVSSSLISKCFATQRSHSSSLCHNCNGRCYHDSSYPLILFAHILTSYTRIVRVIFVKTESLDVL